MRPANVSRQREHWHGDRIVAILVMLALLWGQFLATAHSASANALPGSDICSVASSEVDGGLPEEADAARHCHDCCCAGNRLDDVLPATRFQPFALPTAAVAVPPPQAAARSFAPRYLVPPPRAPPVSL